MKKILIILIFGLIFLSFAQAGFSAIEGDPCCKNEDCGDPTLYCACPTSQDCEVGIINNRTFRISGTTGVCVKVGYQSVCPPIPIVDPLTFINNLITKILIFIFPLATLMIIIGAFVFLTSGGIPKRVSLGKKIIFWTLIGLAIILFSKGLISMIRAIL